MKIIFIGRDNTFNRGVIAWLAHDHEIAACLFVENELFTLKGIINRVRSRSKKYGVLKAANEVAFHVFDHLFLRKKDDALLRAYAKDFLTRELAFPSHDVRNVNLPEWIDFIRAQDADIVFSVCTTVIFAPELLHSTRLGTFVVHDGVTPEYKGLHTTLWALMKKEPHGLGCTLLRANMAIDSGECLFQQDYKPASNESYKTWSTVTHKGILVNLPYMRAALKQLEAQQHFIPLKTSGRREGYYTWMGLTDFVRLYFKYHFRET